MGVALDFQVLAELLLTDGPAVAQEALDLAEDEGVALDSGGVVGFAVPDLGPDTFGLDRRGEAAEALAELVDQVCEALMDGGARRAAPAGADAFSRRAGRLFSNGDPNYNATTPMVVVC